MALKRWAKRFVPDCEEDGDVAALPLADGEEVLADGSSLRLKRDRRLGAAAGGTFGVHSGASESPSVSCIVDIERNLSDRSSSVAGEAGVRGDGTSFSSGTMRVSRRDGTCECAVYTDCAAESARDGPALGPPRDSGGEYMLSSSRGSRGSRLLLRRGCGADCWCSISSPSAGETRRRFGIARLCWLELERSRLFTESLLPLRPKSVEIRRRRLGR